MLVGILSSFSYVGGADAKAAVKPYTYSGGSGTEDDPYLISTAKDLTQICRSIEKDPSLQQKKVYYKLTNDISPTDKYPNLTISPVYGFRGGSPHCYYPPDASPISRHNAAFTGVFDGNGYSIKFNTRGYIFGFLENGAEVKNLTLKGHGSLAFSVSESSRISNCVIMTDVSVKGFGIYDSSIWCTEEYGCFTMFIYEIYSGAIAKNYGTIENCINYSKGLCGLAGYNYDTGRITNCANYGEILSFDRLFSPSDEAYRLLTGDYISGSDINSGNLTYDEFKKGNKVARVISPEVNGINGGTACIDYANVGEAVSGDGYFTANECEAANGNARIFEEEGFDFENTWIMVGGYPVLRATLSAITGDLNMDGHIDIIDANLLKRYLSSTPESNAYIFYSTADINMDRQINAMDSYFLQCYLIGI